MLQDAARVWSWVCSSSVFVWRRAGGPVSFRGCEGGRGAEHALCRARFFAERASLQSTLLCALLCRARFFAEHSPLRASLQSTLLCRAHFFAEHASLQSILLLLCRARSADMLPGCEGGRGASQLWSWVCSSSVFVLRRAGGPVSFRGCEGGRGASQLWSCVLRQMASQLWRLCCLVLRGMEASQLWSCVVLFCGESRRVSFRGCEKGMI